VASLAKSLSGVALATAIALAAPCAAAQTDLGQRLDEHLQRLVPWGFSGAVLVARSGRVVLATGYGMADRAHGLPNSALTQFPLAGASQQFTAVAVLLLADQGRLSIDDALGAHLEGVPSDKQAITLRQLLHHESGLPADVGLPFGAVESKEEALARILGAPLESVPGTRCNPSSAGYALLCAVVEKLGALPFEEFVRTKIFEPSDMRTSLFIGDARAASAPLAHAYVDDNDQGSPASWQPSWPLRGAGAMVSSVGDLYRWERALVGEGLLSARAVELLHEPMLGNSACGLFIQRSDADRRVAQRSSDLAGFQIEVRRGLDDPLSWTLLLNEAMPAAVKHVDALINGRTLALPPEVGALDPKLAAAAAGAYELPGGGRLRVFFERGRMSLAAENQGAVDALAPPTAESKAWENEFGARSVALCENLRGRDFPAAAALLGRTAVEVDSEMGTWWRKLEQRLGASSPPKLLACVAREETVAVKIDFERGAEIVWFVWNGRVLTEFHPGPAIFSSGRLWPAKDSGLVTYDPASLSVRRLALMLRADGSVRGLSFATDAGEASDSSARRLD